MNDHDIENLIKKEHQRQLQNIELIASENIVSPAVMQAMGSILTNKYAEGYPSKRYYGGCEVIDEIENIAIERLKKLFQVEYVNVQPHSGSQANQIVFNACLKPGDTVLSMQLSEGGHLTHGSPVNVSGQLYNFHHYSLKKDCTIDYDELDKIALEIKPKMIIAGGSAYSRHIDFKRFRQVADSCQALLLADIAHYAGLIAAHMYPSPLPFADIVTSTTHKTLRGPRGGIILTNNKEWAVKINKSLFPGFQGGPLMHQIAAKAVAFQEALEPSFKDYIRQVITNSQVLASHLTDLNFDIVTGGTDSHMFLLNLCNKDITGKEAESILDSVHITTNKNTVPFDSKSPFITSGLRIGTSAITTRGMKQQDMLTIAHFINDSLTYRNDETKLSLIKEEVIQFTSKFPLFQGI